MNTPQPTTTKYLGQEGEDPTAPPWGSGNYVGPYWSNGKVQSSVEWGDKEPLNELDALARQHDAAYAHFKDEKHREAADAIFAAEARKLKTKYGSKLADNPQFAAMMVEYGNHTTRQIKKLASSGMFVPGLAPFAVLKYGIDHVKEFTARIKGTHLKNETLDVRKFYESDTKGHKDNTFPEVFEVRAGGLANGGSWKDPTIDRTSSVQNESNRPGWQEVLTPVKTAVKRATATGNKVKPVLVSANETNNENLIRSQATRLANYRALHDAALASNKGVVQVYHKRKLNLNNALPKKYKTKRNAVRSI